MLKTARTALLIFFMLSVTVYTAYSSVLSPVSAAAAAGQSSVQPPAAASVSFQSTTSNPLIASSAVVKFSWLVTTGTYRLRVEVQHPSGPTVAEATIAAGTASVTLSLSPQPNIRQITNVKVSLVKIT